MHQAELNRALSRATGESVGTIKRLGFSLLEANFVPCDLDSPEVAPQVVDWDRLEIERIALAIQA